MAYIKIAKTKYDSLGIPFLIQKTNAGSFSPTKVGEDLFSYDANGNQTYHKRADGSFSQYKLGFGALKKCPIDIFSEWLVWGEITKKYRFKIYK